MFCETLGVECAPRGALQVVYWVFYKKRSERLVMACRVIDEITSGKKEHAMTEKNVSAAIVVLKEMLRGEEDFVREAVWMYLQQVLEQQITLAVGVAKGRYLQAHLSNRALVGQSRNDC